MPVIKEADYKLCRKEKLRGQLRRKKTFQKRDKRMKQAKRNVFSSWSGYWVVDKVRYCRYKDEILPAETVEHFTVEPTIVVFNEGTDYAVQTIINRVMKYIERIPERRQRRLVDWGFEKIAPRLARKSSTEKKYRKKLSNRKIRNSKEIYSNGSYKKVNW